MRMGEGGAQSWLVLVYRTGPVLRVLTFIRTVAVCLAPVALNWFGLYALHSSTWGGVVGSTAPAAGDIGNFLRSPHAPGPPACAQGASAVSTSAVMTASTCAEIAGVGLARARDVGGGFRDATSQRRATSASHCAA